jgi:hypothetical protein
VLYDDIARIEKHAEAPWTILGLGALATALLLAQNLVGLGLLRYLVPWTSSALSPFGLSGMAGTLVDLIPFVPVLAAGAGFFSAVKRGYLVHYGSSRKLFLPDRFGKALKLADKLTPKELLGVDGEPVAKTG